MNLEKAIQDDACMAGPDEQCHQGKQKNTCTERSPSATIFGDERVEMNEAKSGSYSYLRSLRTETLQHKRKVIGV